ncbi:sodium-dependent transporter [Alkalilimnicola ehrlichii]|uniref:Transporter n=1 Tax=Alkalilimnicola ehrlichii TaxID=351052 RepID=A0A3E0WJ36_9GAMM|nr:sodium-dependent transporter [Alkalilimnicola ehrlichii]RFA24497.1 sodium-dependent transporter [Alkalilimnicola ehrlichii]RFA32161.1 sodium-dependent transporter [Alkalilimnicola ehrlichii]
MSAMTEQPGQRGQWSSEPAFVFSMAAAAVGLGNLWRFPYMLGENGGAAFIIAYLIALLVVALPVMMLEVGAGRLAQGSAVETFRRVHRFGAIYGWAIVVLTIAISSYYLVITGWTLGYAVGAVTLSVDTFDDFTVGYNSVWFFLITTVLAALVLIKGVSAIEKFSKLLMPVLLGVIVLLVIIATRMDGWAEARAFMFQADFSMLSDPRLWVFAFGQAFYTLAIGQGYLITYGSYIPKNVHVPRACLIVAGTETSIALLAGLMIFPYVFTFGMDPGEGSQLAFSTLPVVFEQMRGGWFLAILFFSLFFLAAFSSCLAGLKVVIAAFEEEFRMDHVRAVLAVGVLMLFLGLPSALSFTPVQLSVAGMPFLDFMDQFGGTNVVILSGIVGAGLFSWLVPRERIHDSLGASKRWWQWRIVIVGRALPFLGVLWLGWVLFG